MRLIALLLISTIPLLTACRSQPAAAEPAKADEHAPIAQWAGQHSGREAAGTEVLRRAEEWDAFWKKVGGDRPRPLNVSREMAVAIYLGGKRTGGFSAEVLRTHELGGKLIVEYRETTPERGSMVTQELTTPWAIAIVGRADLPVVTQNTGARPPAPREK